MSARQGMCPGEWETMEKFLSNKGSPGEWETIKKFLSPPRDQRVGNCRCSSPHFGVGMSARQGMCPGEWETIRKFLSNKGCPGEWETIKKFLSPPRDQRVGSCRCSSPHFGVGMSVRQGMCSGEWETIRKFLSSRVSREWETVEAPLPRLQEGPCVTTHTGFTSLPTGGPITRGSLPSQQEAEYSFSEFIPTIKQKNKKISES